MGNEESADIGQENLQINNQTKSEIPPETCGREVHRSSDLNRSKLVIAVGLLILAGRCFWILRTRLDTCPSSECEWEGGGAPAYNLPLPLAIVEGQLQLLQHAGAQKHSSTLLELRCGAHTARHSEHQELGSIGKVKCGFHIDVWMISADGSAIGFGKRPRLVLGKQSKVFGDLL
eukprot:CAMPEP_0194782550 /NCGR_PEP_ID=MMETSP0323_2-20130528/78751_1 /TAXON_ID=2866 ORGANISM="Crypthecodinium cohnii, Strain Seligo" /NCGR_SAMPLE_ID=MMETSP0323_2 /ASSEMBLY_ACC=CAM_ASM_000346 /LENGTH=174 /DNA_ID=CAMNT_0039721373 /DNA_START=317 /DNA_END=841 /DNA_ORIENTATION=+